MAPSTLSLSPGLFRYDLEQHTTVHIEGEGDAVPHIITTTALLLVEVLLHSDSGYDVMISVDSVKQAAEGFDGPSPTHPGLLGPVLRASFSPAATSTYAQLADSLCAYSQFVTVARQLVLPKLPAQLSIRPDNIGIDTMQIAGCRVGIPIRIESTQELRDLKGDPLQLTIEERATIRGSGRLQKDSIEIEGSLRAKGTASFTPSFRLPAAVQSESEGSIAIQLGDSTVTFRQTVTQHLRRRSDAPN